MKPATQRFWIIISCMLGLGTALALVLSAFSSNLVYFITPSQLINLPSKENHTIRLGGIVAAGSLHYERQGQIPIVHFQITDGKASIEVSYSGILPDLFHEGRAAIAIGFLDSKDVLLASEVLAKHDEKYMPKKLANSLCKSKKVDPHYIQ